METLSQIYINIKKLRQELHMSQDELAKKTGYTDRSSIAKIEAGHVDLNESKIATFAKALNTTPALLFGWPEPEEEKSGYYLDPEAAELAQELHDNPDLRAMLDASRNVSPESLKTIIKMIKGAGED